MKAFQYDGTNSIMQFFGDVINLNVDGAGVFSPTVRTCTTDNVPLNPDDWVLEDNSGLIKVMGDAAFKYEYMGPILGSLGFIKWYSGATEEMIMRAYKRYLREEINNESKTNDL